MALQIYIAHTGVQLTADTNTFSSVDDLKTWIASNSSIRVPQQILMTATGKAIKLQNLYTEKELFVYNRDYLVVKNRTGAHDLRIQLPQPFQTQTFPSADVDEDSIEEWRALYGERKVWALQIFDQCDSMITQSRRYHDEIANVRKATSVAIEPIRQHLGGLEEKHRDADKWAEDTIGEQTRLLKGWTTSFDRLAGLPAHSNLKPFLRFPNKTKSGDSKSPASLQSFLEIEELQNAASKVETAEQSLRTSISEFRSVCENAIERGSSLVHRVIGTSGPSVENTSAIVDGLAEEVVVNVQKLSKDCDSALNRPSTAKDLSWFSRTSSFHTHELLPSIQTIAAEISDALRETVDLKNRTIDLALTHMQEISSLQSVLAGMQPKLEALELDPEGSAGMDALDFVQQLPSIYASLLVECVRRHEWIERMTSDSSNLAEEMAVYREEEEKRRKRWFKTVVDYVNTDLLDGAVMGIEVNIKSKQQNWPRLVRIDIDDYTAALGHIQGLEPIVREIKEMKQTLDQPSKQQYRRTNAFKNGSIQDVTFGKTSLLMRGDHELILSLQSDKSRLEERLKGSDSRIRKLEDLLHRQSQIQSRPVSRGEATANERTATPPSFGQKVPGSPRATETSPRRFSFSSRRLSATYTEEVKTLMRRITQLEGELQTQEQESNQLVKRAEKLKIDFEEADTIKADLMANFEAQQREFGDERRILQDESRQLKDKVDALEEELDRMIGSQDTAKIGIDEKTRQLETEVAKIRSQAVRDVDKAQGQVDSLRSDYAAQREKTSELERQAAQYETEKQDLRRQLLASQSQIQDSNVSREDHARALRAVHTRLSTSQELPATFDTLVGAVEQLSDKAVNHLEELKQALEATRAENVRQKEIAVRRVAEVDELKDFLGSKELEVFNLHEEIADVKARYESLERELEDERRDMDSLRSQATTDASVVKGGQARLNEEQARVEHLNRQLAATQAHNGQLQASLQTLSDRLKDREVLDKQVSARYERCARQAETVSNKLFSRTDRLTHLLEHIGFTVTRHNGELSIQRTARTANPASSMIEQSQVLGKSVSNALPTRPEAVPPPYLQWSVTHDADEEQGMFRSFMEDIDAFSIDAFSEAVIKRIKDTEHIARKWQREAKSYREKFHRAQFDAQNKIAFRSFKEGDLALFLPTRNQAAKRSWAAFNVGAPHYFLREQEHHMLNTRDWLLARISRVEDRVVDLSQDVERATRSGLQDTQADGNTGSEDDNPFGLSDGLRWYFLDAAEEKLGAPSTPAKSALATATSTAVDAAGSIERKDSARQNFAARTLTKSLDSRRSSTNSKKSAVGGAAVTPLNATGTLEHAPLLSSASSALRPSPSRDSIPEEAVVAVPDLRGADRAPEPAKSATLAPPRPQQQARQQSRAWDALWSVDLSLGKK